MRMIKRKFLLLAALPLLLASCIADRFEDQPGGGKLTGKETSVRVSLRMPNAAPNTYAINAKDENHVKEIEVLAFKAVTVSAQNPSGWAFAYKAKGSTPTNVNDDGSTKQFNVTLIKSADQQLFVVLANVSDQIAELSDIAVGADKDGLLTRLIFENGDSWNANNDKADNDPDKSFDPFPMWGEVTTTLTDGTTEITGLSMLRGIARMDVILSSDVIADANFKLDEIHIFNAKTKGHIVPDPAHMENGKAIAPTIPAGNINTTALKYLVPDGMETAFERTIYTFEAKGTTENKASEATCLVIGGTFGNDGRTTYYRVDFLKKNETDSYFRDILRNHHYRINITKVKGSGYPNPETAFNSKSLNIVVDIRDWDDGDKNEVVFDGQYFMSFSEKELYFSQFATPSPQTITIRTNVPDLSISDFIDRNDAGDGEWAETTPGSDIWSNGHFTVTFTKGSKNASGEYSATLTVTALATNDGDPMRETNFSVKGGKLEATIKLIQDRHVVYRLTITSPNPQYPITLDGTARRVPIEVESTHNYMIVKNDGIGMFGSFWDSAVDGTTHDITNIPSNVKKLWVEVTNYNGSSPRIATLEFKHTALLSDANSVTLNVIQVQPQLSAQLTKGGYDTSMDRAGGSVDINVTSNMNSWSPKVYKDEVEVSNPEAYFGGLTAGSGNQKVTFTLSSPATANTVYKVKFVSGTKESEAITITHKFLAITIPTMGVIAPPGVIGVGATSGKLTLDGSKEYYGGSNETVYIVYFKYGSTIAISDHVGAFNAAEHVAWAPEGFDGAITTYATIPRSTAWPSNENNPKGLGDPCKLTQNSTKTGVWHTPTYSDWNKYTKIGQVSTPITLIRLQLGNYAAEDFPDALGVAGNGTGRWSLLPVCTYWGRTDGMGLETNAASNYSGLLANGSMSWSNVALPIRCVK